MLCVIICENDECPHMWWGHKHASKEPVREPEHDAALTMHNQPTAVRLVESQPLISSVVTLIMHRIIALVPFDIDQAKWKQFCEGSNWNHMLIEPDTLYGFQQVREHKFCQTITKHNLFQTNWSYQWGRELRTFPKPPWWSVLSLSCLPNSRAPTPLTDSREKQARHLICTVYVCVCVSHIIACRYLQI